MNPQVFHEKLGELDSSLLTIENVTLALSRFCHEYSLSFDRKIESYVEFKKSRKINIKEGIKTNSRFN